MKDEAGLPDNVVNFTTFKITRDIKKICQCPDPTYVIDTKNRLVTCSQCGAYTDPFDALMCLAEKPERLEREVGALLNQRREIANYKPHMIVFRELEQHYRKGKHGRMLPRCPHCRNGFYFEKITGWVNEEYAKEEQEE